MQVAMLYLLAVHLFGCAYWAIATRYPLSQVTLDDAGCDRRAVALVETWGVCPELRTDGDLFSRYFHSFYWAAVVMKGSNYPAPLEVAHKSFTVLVLLLGAILQVRRPCSAALGYARLRSAVLGCARITA